VGDSHQVNCKGDKIENITQLLMHLGMDDIKDKCDDCDIEVRNACLAKQSQAELLKRTNITTESMVTERIVTERIVTEKKVAGKRITEKADTDSQRVDTHLLSNRLLNGKERSIENKLILSSIFASIFVVAMRF
jgi:hypothetical protein